MCEEIMDILQLFTFGVLAWTGYETLKMRTINQKQAEQQCRPVLSFVPRSPAYVIKNESGNVALNVFCFSKRGNSYYILQTNSHVVSILGAGGDTGSGFQGAGFDKETPISQKELLIKFPWVKSLLSKLNEEDAITRLVVCYEGVFKNKLYTFINSSGGAYDFAGETGYVKDLNQPHFLIGKFFG